MLNEPKPELRPVIQSSIGPRGLTTTRWSCENRGFGFVSAKPNLESLGVPSLRLEATEDTGEGRLGEELLEERRDENV